MNLEVFALPGFYYLRMKDCMSLPDANKTFSWFGCQNKEGVGKS